MLTFGRRVAFDGRDGYLVAVVDISERRAAEARIAHMAHHDGLTNLPNREFYQERLRQALERAQPGNRRVAVLCVDLDLFKHVNDSFGHPMGDRLLKQVAERLKSEIRGDNLVARLGGDEFAIVLVSEVSPNEVSDFADRLIGVLSARYELDGIDVVVGASVGITLSPGDGASCEELMRNADMALYRAKSDGGNVHRSSSARWTARHRSAATWNATCAAPSRTVNSNCIISRWWILPPTASTVLNRCCAGAVRKRA